MAICLNAILEIEVRFKHFLDVPTAIIGTTLSIERPFVIAPQMIARPENETKSCDACDRGLLLYRMALQE